MAADLANLCTAVVLSFGVAVFQAVALGAHELLVFLAFLALDCDQVALGANLANGHFYSFELVSSGSGWSLYCTC